MTTTILRESIVKFDRYLRGWTSARMIRNAITAGLTYGSD